MQLRQDYITAVKGNRRYKTVKRIAQGMWRCTEFVELRGEAFSVGNMSAMLAEV